MGVGPSAGFNLRGSLGSDDNRAFRTRVWCGPQAQAQNVNQLGVTLSASSKDSGMLGHESGSGPQAPACENWEGIEFLVTIQDKGAVKLRRG